MRDDLQILPFQPEHLLGLEARSFEAREMALDDCPLRRSADYQRRGLAYTVTKGGKIMFCVGLLLLWRGVAELWMVTTDLVQRSPLAFHRVMLQGLTVMMDNLGLWRLQTAVHSEHHLSQKWLRRMGFKYEGAMPAYGPDGATYIRMARVNRPE